LDSSKSVVNAAGRALDRGRVKRWVVHVAALVSGVLLIVLLVLVVVIVRYGKHDRVQAADVIIVLGGGEDGTIRRAEHGAALYAVGYAPFMICTGGVGEDDISEAERCAQRLIALGVPESAIVLEEESLSTEENAIESRAIMDRQGWQSAVLVSDDFHLWRAHWLYREQDITVYPSPAQKTTGSLPVLESTYSVLRELAAVGWHVGKSVLGLPYTHTAAFLRLN